jgi:hypothetical protein
MTDQDPPPDSPSGAPPSEPAPVTWSVRRLNRLVAGLGVRTYLEIGVSKGATFLQVDVPHRTGVDPALAVDPALEIDATTVLVERSSDAFFADLEPDRTFDLVFIDGLHTFDQTYRDLCNALAHAHVRTAILIDDTVPSDPWSALPNLDRSMRMRRLAKAPGSPWHGDVYKVVAAIHSFHPSLDYRTIVGSGNPQSLVWKGARDDPGPPPLTLDAIAHMSYFDLLDRPALLREAAEDVAIDACLRSITGGLPSEGTSGPT